MRSGMTTVRPEGEGTVLAGQLPVNPGTRSLEVNGAKDGSAACPEACAADACEDGAPEPVQDPASSSGTMLAASHRRRRRLVRGAGNVPHLYRASSGSDWQATVPRRSCRTDRFRPDEVSTRKPARRRAARECAEDAARAAPACGQDRGGQAGGGLEQRGGAGLAGAPRRAAIRQPRAGMPASPTWRDAAGDPGTGRNGHIQPRPYQPDRRVLHRAVTDHRLGEIIGRETRAMRP